MALAMVEGPARALELVDEIAADGRLDSYLYLHATRGERLRRLGRLEEARRAYGRALELVDNNAERRLLESRLERLAARSGEVGD